jgi:hypothetical protein
MSDIVALIDVREEPPKRPKTYSRPHSDWLGIDEIISWVFDSPLSVSALIVGAVLFWGSILVGGIPETISARRRQISN